MPGGKKPRKHVLDPPLGVRADQKMKGGFLGFCPPNALKKTPLPTVFLQWGEVPTVVSLFLPILSDFERRSQDFVFSCPILKTHFPQLRYGCSTQASAEIVNFKKKKHVKHNPDCQDMYISKARSREKGDEKIK